MLPKGANPIILHNFHNGAGQSAILDPNVGKIVGGKSRHDTDTYMLRVGLLPTNNAVRTEFEGDHQICN